MVEEAELWGRSAGGAEVWLLAKALPLTAGSGAWIGARGVCRDITRLRCHEAELAEARNRERLFSYIVNMVRRELDPARMLDATAEALLPALALRSEEHTSELQSLMRISYAVFCLKKKKHY